jgi:hypothetical protein
MAKEETLPCNEQPSSCGNRSVTTTTMRKGDYIPRQNKTKAIQKTK